MVVVGATTSRSISFEPVKVNDTNDGVSSIVYLIGFTFVGNNTDDVDGDEVAGELMVSSEAGACVRAAASSEANDRGVPLTLWSDNTHTHADDHSSLSILSHLMIHWW